MGKDVLERLGDRELMIVSFEGRNDRLIFDSSNEIINLRSDLAAEKRRVIDITLELGVMREKCEGLEEGVREYFSFAFKRGDCWLDHQGGCSSTSQDRGPCNCGAKKMFDAARSEQSKAPIPHGTCEEGVADDRT